MAFFRFWLCVFSMIALAGCERVDQPVMTVRTFQPYDRKIEAHDHYEGDFSSFKVYGKIDVTLKHGARSMVQVLAGDPLEIEEHGSEAQRELSLRELPRYAQTDHYTKVLIQTPDLENFSYDGTGEVRIQNVTGSASVYIRNPKGTTLIDGPRLSIEMLKLHQANEVVLYRAQSLIPFISLKGNTQLILNQNSRLRRLEMEDNTQLQAQWINADQLDVAMKGNSKATAFGTVRDLHLDLEGHAQWRGRQISVQNVFAHAQSSSYAEVSGMNRMMLQASGQGQIDYYPMYRNTFLSLWNKDGGRLLNIPAADPLSRLKPKDADRKTYGGYCHFTSQN